MKYIKNLILFCIFTEVITCFVLLENSSGKGRFA